MMIGQFVEFPLHGSEACETASSGSQAQKMHEEARHCREQKLFIFVLLQNMPRMTRALPATFYILVLV